MILQKSFNKSHTIWFTTFSFYFYLLFSFELLFFFFLFFYFVQLSLINFTHQAFIITLPFKHFCYELQVLQTNTQKLHLVVTTLSNSIWKHIVYLNFSYYTNCYVTILALKEWWGFFQISALYILLWQIEFISMSSLKWNHSSEFV